MRSHSLPRIHVLLAAAVTLCLGVGQAVAQDVLLSDDGSAELASARSGEVHGPMVGSSIAPVESARFEAAGERGGSSLLYSGGPLVTCTDCVGEGGGLGDGSVLESVTLGMNTLGFNHNMTAFRLAQPFVVPAGGWQLDLLHTFAYDTGSTLTSTQTGVFVRIWNGHPDDSGSSIVFGDLTTNRMTATEWSGIYRVSEGSPTLTNRPIMVQTSTIGHTLAQGEYWIEWTATAQGGNTPWAPPVTVPGACYTGNGWGYSVSAETWVRRRDSGAGECGQGFPIRLLGSGAPSPAFTPSTTMLTAGFLADGSPDLRAGDPVQTFSIRNLAGPSFTWNIVESEAGCAATNLPWLSVSPTSGTTAEGMTSEVTVTFDPAGLAPGVYTGELCIEGNAPTDVVSVRMILLEDQEQLLLIPSSVTAERFVSVFDYHFGNLILEGFAPYGDVFTAVPWGLSVNFDGDGFFMATGQAGAAARIQEFDGFGQYVGEFAAPGGTSRGIHLTPDGMHLAVANQTDNSITLINDQGVVTGTLIAPGAGGLNNPVDFVFRDSDILVSSAGNNAILRYGLDGTFIDVFHQWGSVTPGQMIQAANGNIIATITSVVAERGWYEFTPGGTLVVRHDPELVSPMGVHELPTGNLLVSNSNGVRELDRVTGEIVAVHHAGGNNRFILPVPEDMITFPPIAVFDPPDGLEIMATEGQMAGGTFTIGNAGELDLAFGPIVAQGESFFVGGTPSPGEPHNWDFQGAGSNTDGTYTSTHLSAFDNALDQGTWHFEFVKTFGGTSTMNWSDVTVTLLKAGGDGQHDPTLNEDLNLGSFTLVGTGPEATYTATAEGGVQTQGPVIGFTFTGTVSGITGSGTWASDLRMTMTAPIAFITDVSPTAGTVAADGSVNVTVTVDATGQQAGAMLHGFLAIPTNETSGLRAWWTDEQLESYDEERREGIMAAMASMRSGHITRFYPITMTVEPVVGPGDHLTFNPPINVGLEVTTAAGTTAEGSITLINPTNDPIDFEFAGFADTQREFANPANPLAHVSDRGNSAPEVRGQVVNVPQWTPVRGEGGPDAFGYTWIDSDEPGGPQFEDINIAATGTVLPLTAIPGCTYTADDTGTSQVQLPFTFSFYGQQHTEIWVSTKGYIAFQPVAGACALSGTIPSPNSPTPQTPGAMIAALWGDQVATAADANLLAQQLPDGRFVIQWNRTHYFGQSASRNTYQVILSPSGAIKIQYVEITGNVSSTTRIGQQNHTGLDGLLIAQGAGYAVTGKAVLISSVPPFVTDVSPASGTVPANSSINVTVTFDASDLLDGTYEGTLTIETDEPATYDYPVTLNVVGDPGCVIEPDPIAFGEVIVGFDATMEATVTNEGTAACELTGATVSNNAFSTDFSAVTLQPGASATFNVTFTPTAVGSATGTLTLQGDVNVTAGLSGVGLAPPQAAVEPQALTFVMPPDSESSQSLTLSNQAAAGAADLEFSVAVVAARPVTRPAGRAGEAIVAAGRGQEAGQFGLSSSNRQAGASAWRGGSVEREGIVFEGGPFVQTLFGRGEGDELIQDGSFEAGTPNPYWTEHSATFGTPLCNGSFCNTTVGSGPYTGAWWVWFGGAAGGDFAYVSQEVTIPHGGAELSFFLEIPTVGAPGWVRIYMNNDMVFEATQADGGAYAIYQQVVLDVSAYADGGTHTVRIESDIQGGAITNIFVDDVSLMTTGPGVISVTPTTGSVVAGASQELVVTANSAGLAKGTYEYEVLIQTNDPDNPVLVVDVTVEVQEIDAEPPAGVLTFDLGQNYPNPFAHQTTIDFSVAEAGPVRIDVYDVAGRRVATLVDGQFEAGRHTASWDANGAAAGVYFYRIQSGAFTQTMRALIVR